MESLQKEKLATDKNATKGNSWPHINNKNKIIDKNPTLIKKSE